MKDTEIVHQVDLKKVTITPNPANNEHMDIVAEYFNDEPNIVLKHRQYKSVSNYVKEFYEKSDRIYSLKKNIPPKGDEIETKFHGINLKNGMWVSGPKFKYEMKTNKCYITTENDSIKLSKYDNVVVNGDNVIFGINFGNVNTELFVYYGTDLHVDLIVQDAKLCGIYGM